jgi:hypothetical protein
VENQAEVTKETRKRKVPTTGDFEDASKLWRMEFGCYSFEAVPDGIPSVCARNLQSSSPEYYPVKVGLGRLYARPFTNNRPVGPLSDEIVPSEDIGCTRHCSGDSAQAFRAR